MPETTWPISRHPPGSSRAGPPDPVSISSKWFRHVISRSLTLAFLTHTGRAQRRAVSATLTTTALDRSSLRWFATSPCRAIAEDHQPNGPAPPSPMQHRIKQSDLLHRASLLRFVFTRGPATFTPDQPPESRAVHAISVADWAVSDRLLLLPSRMPEEKCESGEQRPIRMPGLRDCGSFADWRTPVLPVGISACFGMLARRPAFMLARRHERLSVRTVPLDGASRVSLA